MKGDLHPCAVRLMQQLPVRTIERRIVSSPPQGSKYGRSIIIDGIRHDSIHAAKKALRVCNATIYGWLATGRAKR